MAGAFQTNAFQDNAFQSANITIYAVIVTANAAALTPSLVFDYIFEVPTATAIAEVSTPTLSFGYTITATVSTATAALLVPTIEVIFGAILTALTKGYRQLFAETKGYRKLSLQTKGYRQLSLKTLNTKGGEQVDKWYIGGTPYLECTVKTKAGALVNSTVSVSIYNPNRKAVLTDGSMTLESTGVYYYYGYTIPATPVTGVYKWIPKCTDGAIITRNQAAEFEVEEI